MTVPAAPEPNREVSWHLRADQCVVAAIASLSGDNRLALVFCIMVTIGLPVASIVIPKAALPLLVIALVLYSMLAGRLLNYVKLSSRFGSAHATLTESGMVIASQDGDWHDAYEWIEVNSIRKRYGMLVLEASGRTAVVPLSAFGSLSEAEDAVTFATRRWQEACAMKHELELCPEKRFVPPDEPYVWSSVSLILALSSAMFGFRGLGLALFALLLFVCFFIWRRSINPSRIGWSAKTSENAKSKSEEPAIRAFAIAQAHLQGGQPEMALHAAMDLLEAKPHWSISHQQVAHSQLLLMSVDESVQSANKAILIDPRNVTAYLVRARIRSENHHYLEALSDCDRAINLDSTGCEGLAERAVVNAKMRRLDRAYDDGTAALVASNRLKYFPQRMVYAFAAQAFVCCELRAINDALENCRWAFSLRTSADDYLTRAYIRLIMMDPQLAESDLEEAMKFSRAKLHERAAESLRVRARLMKDQIESASSIAKRLFDERADANSFLVMGMVALWRGDPHQAVKWFSSAIQLNPYCAEAQHWRTQALQLLGLPEQSAPALETDDIVEYEPYMYLPKHLVRRP